MINEGGVICPTNGLVGAKRFVFGTLHEGRLRIEFGTMIGSSGCCGSWNTR